MIIPGSQTRGQQGIIPLHSLTLARLAASLPASWIPNCFLHISSTQSAYWLHGTWVKAR